MVCAVWKHKERKVFNMKSQTAKTPTAVLLSFLLEIKLDAHDQGAGNQIKL